jgi:serine/threonine protein kinase
MIPPQNPAGPSPFEGVGARRAPAGQQPQPGRKFVLQNRWEVVSHLGQGGMGTVYIARDLRLANRQCVVKKLRDDFFRQEDKEKALSFFQREAVVLSRLSHPNIVHVLDYFEEHGDYFLVMEYVEGENLQQMLTRRGDPFPEEQVLAWSAQIAEVLHYLHSHDPPVIYRDLKPSNVMIDTKDRVKLVDFGIARPYAEDADNTHVVSAGYSPPEQYWGAADPRSDIYALGATMHFLLTGQEPLALQTSSPRKHNPRIGERTDLLVQRATAQDIWLRFQTAPDMQDELEQALVPGSGRNFKVANWVIAFMAILVTGLSVLAFTRFADMNKNQSEEKAKTAKLERELQAVMKQQHSKDKELEIMRKYANSNTEKGAEETRQTGVQIAGTDLGATPKLKRMTTAFKEQDEAQLTDPEGLPPIDGQNPAPAVLGPGDSNPDPIDQKP